jgi:hypothetical protein
MHMAALGSVSNEHWELLNLCIIPFREGTRVSRDRRRVAFRLAAELAFLYSKLACGYQLGGCLSREVGSWKPRADSSDTRIG